MTQSWKSLRIAFVGAGAMGSYIGGRIAQAGSDVTLIDGWAEHVEAIRRDGIRLTGTEGAATVRVAAMHANEMRALAARPVDVAFIAVKSYDTEWAAKLARDFLSPAGCAVSLQNGINEPTIAAVVGAARTVGRIASTIGVALRGPGHVERTYRPGGAGYTVFRVGEPDGRITERVRRIVAMLSVVDSSQAIEDLPAERWAKLPVPSQEAIRALVRGVERGEVTPAVASIDGL
jgi:2-dehydropantoate 2-reductase